jgi:hypothetical protein
VYCRVVRGEGLTDQVDVVLGVIGQAPHGADLTGQLAQDCGVVTGPVGDRPVTRASVALGAYTFLTGPLASVGGS